MLWFYILKNENGTWEENLHTLKNTASFGSICSFSVATLLELPVTQAPGLLVVGGKSPERVLSLPLHQSKGEPRVVGKAAGFLQNKMTWVFPKEVFIANRYSHSHR